MKKVKNFINPKPDPKQKLREWKQKLQKESRNIDRQIREIQMEERKVQKAIKEAAKLNDMVIAKELAKEIVMSKRTVARLHENKANLNSLSLRLGESIATARIVRDISKTTDVMKVVNDLMKAPEMAKTMQEFTKEMTKAGIINEFVIDAVDDALDSEGMEEEINEEVDKVLAVIMRETVAELPEVVNKEKINAPVQKVDTLSEEEEIVKEADEEELEEIRDQVVKSLDLN